MGNGKINYSEFISATICVKSFVNDAKLKVIFQQLDTSNTGVISEQDLFNAFQKMGQEVSLKSIKQMIAIHDTKRNGVLDYDEFVQIFFDQQQIP